jgi:mono/diheme cytochrome c family protein
MRRVPQHIAVCSVIAVLTVPSLVFADAAADYKGKCRACHGPDGVPSEVMAKSMGVKPLGGDEVQAMSDADLSTAIANGKGKMKGMKGTLTDAQIGDLVKYIRTLKK